MRPTVLLESAELGSAELAASRSSHSGAAEVVDALLTDVEPS